MGPLSSLKVVELAGLAPAPFATTVLADLGADVVRVDRAKPGFDVLTFPHDPLSRSRRWIGVDTKSQEGRDIVLRLVEDADVLIEGFRPGVTERLGIGPDDCLARNPGLIYGRITGWGQDGPLAQAAGHDINYIGLAGALEPIGRAGERPVPPLNLLGDFGGGGMLLAMGVLAALVERSVSGRGQVVDASMVEGSALLTAGMHGLKNIGLWSKGRGENMLDGGAPFYDTYETSDGKYVAVGAIEERFWGDLVKVLEIDPSSVAGRLDPAQWEPVRSILAAAIRTRTRDEWTKRAEGTDACLTPVLDTAEAAAHPHNVARGTFVALDGHTQPSPAPKFSRTTAETPTPPVEPRSSTTEVLTDLGYAQSEIDRLRTNGVIA
ncbi:CaiB/BaiF CoA transferase family protein [Actinophytocola algeriensis]|jgi:alpha-methylacyl-CoA racemase|uniref:Alpha-methylacyl-CoA racemase n=1 Tax=Actinophytocola algeriensis TaxID=1768010 RepID=A0A7W7QBN9_9PSEU|nr:CaiB/BaiF CoA-transferase family protein [Actinophytocola algeriensis]MBB4910196.1 alpha-methylacyl-CoA racemase [Actinophytocola algeriensis]MBE1480815.1 alpha-methylacyl-CoA racemase [Actinophytocola algeriensis]